MADELELDRLKPPSTGWKDWLMAALWITTLALAGLGYASIKESISDVSKGQMAQTSAFSQYQLDNEKRWSTVWRVVDKICGYQTEQLRKDGKTPDYHIEGRP